MLDTYLVRIRQGRSQNVTRHTVRAYDASDALIKIGHDVASGNSIASISIDNGLTRTQQDVLDRLRQPRAGVVPYGVSLRGWPFGAKLFSAHPAVISALVNKGYARYVAPSPCGTTYAHYILRQDND